MAQPRSEVLTPLLGCFGLVGPVGLVPLFSFSLMIVTCFEASKCDARDSCQKWPVMHALGGVAGGRGFLK